MRNYITFMKKELIEGIRAYKMIILFVVFLIFGIMNPLFAKLAPDLVSSLTGESISINIPEPTAIDSWMQFFKNISQMGFIVIAILYSGIIAQEINKGTLINLLTKGLSRTTVILAKYTIALLSWTIAYALCFLVTLGYTVYLFPEDYVANIGFAVVALWIFGILLISFLLLAASATRNNYSCLLVTGLFIVALTIAGIAPSTHDFNPMSLATDSTALMTNAVDPIELVPAIAIAIIGSCVCLITAILVFRTRQL